MFRFSYGIYYVRGIFIKKIDFIVIVIESHNE